MTARQRAAAKQRKLNRAKVERVSASERLGPIIDYSNQTDLLDAHIEAGRMVSIVTFYKLKTDVPGKFQHAMMQAGMTVGDAFEMLCLMRRSMMETMGFKDPSMTVGADFEFEVEPVAREGVSDGYQDPIGDTDGAAPGSGEANSFRDGADKPTEPSG